MAQYNRTNFKTAQNNRFLDNETEEIEEVDFRNYAADVADSHFNLTDDAFSGARGTSPGVSNITDLKAIATASVTVGPIVIFRDTSSADLLRVYQLVSGTTAESSPDFIRPNDYDGTTNTKVWRLAKVIPRYSRPNISTIAGLKAILTAGVSGLELGTYISFADSGSSDVLRTYKLTAGTTAESSPNVIRPDDYAGTTNEKIWVLMTHAIIGGTP
jgi:hypothetical protein